MSVVRFLTAFEFFLQNKCEQYWPDSSINFGSITVTLQKTQKFADYIIRTFKLVKVGKWRIFTSTFISWKSLNILKFFVSTLKRKIS